MNQFTFPKFTEKERHNAKCFEDFKHYLDGYIEDDNTQKYHDYEFNRHILLSEGLDKKQKFKALTPQPFSQLSAWIEEGYATENSLTKKLPKTDLIMHLANVLSDYTENERELLYGLIMQEKFETFLMSFKTNSVDELKKLSRTSLDKYQRNIEVAV